MIILFGEGDPILLAPFPGDRSDECLGFAAEQLGSVGEGTDEELLPIP